MTYQVTVTFSDLGAITSLNPNIFNGATAKLTDGQDVILEAGNIDAKLFNDICNILSNPQYDGSHNRLLNKDPEKFVEIVSQEVGSKVTLHEGLTQTEIDFLTLRMRDLGWEEFSQDAIFKQLSYIWRTSVPNDLKLNKGGLNRMWQEIKKYSRTKGARKYILELHADGSVLAHAVYPVELKFMEVNKDTDLKILISDSEGNVYYIPKGLQSNEEYLDYCSTLLTFINHPSFSETTFRLLSVSKEDFLAEGLKAKRLWERRAQ